MQQRLLSRLIFVLGLALLPVLSAQPTSTPTSSPPANVAQLRKEQELLSDIYLARCQSEIIRGVQRIGTGATTLARDNAASAGAYIAYFKNLADYNGPRIPFARTGIVLASGSTMSASEEQKRGLKEKLETMLKRRFDLEEQLLGLGRQIGDPELLAALESAILGNTGSLLKIAPNIPKPEHDDPTKSGQNDQAKGSGGARGPHGEIQNGGMVTLPASGPGQKECSLEGQLSADGRTIATSQFGTVNLTSLFPTANGKRVYQTTTGVLELLTNCSGAFFPNATLLPDGTIQTRDGTRIDPATVEQKPNGDIAARTPDNKPVNFDPSGEKKGEMRGAYSGSPDANQLVGVDYDGDAPPFVGGKRAWIRTTYPNGKGNLLQAEKKIRQEVVEQMGDKLRVQEFVDGAPRSWLLQIDVANVKPVDGGGYEATVSLLDKNGNSSALKIDDFAVEDATGNASPVVSAVAGSANARKVKFAKTGDYVVSVRGETDWGSKFSVQSGQPVGTR